MSIGAPDSGHRHGTDAATFLEAMYLRVHRYITDKNGALSPDARVIIGDFFDFGDKTLESLHAARIAELAKNESDLQQKKILASNGDIAATIELQIMKEEAEKERQEAEAEEDFELGLSLAAAISDAAADDSGVAALPPGTTMADALAPDPPKKRSPKEKAAQYMEAVQHAKTMEKILAPARPRVASDASDETTRSAERLDRQVTRGSMANMVSPEMVLPQKRKAEDDRSVTGGGAQKRLKDPSKYD